MRLYLYDKQPIATELDLPLEEISSLPQGAPHPVWLFNRPISASRASFCASDPALLTQSAEGPWWLDSSQLGRSGLPEWLQLLGPIRAVNAAHPRWQSLIAPPEQRQGKRRLNILAMGDVGSTLAIGLRLMGAETLSTIGIFDINDSVAKRWEFELNQISPPTPGTDLLPEVSVVSLDSLFDCDVFVFCASMGVPPVGSGVKDVRMAQLEGNARLVSQYARMARERGFTGLFIVMSDPVDQLCLAALDASNDDGAGGFDGLGLLPEQVVGLGLGVMNARARYYAKRDDELKSYLTEGRVYGPHGEGLVAANSLWHYDDALTERLTSLVVKANMQMRALGFKPFVAPAMSSGALSIVRLLSGEWHYSSVFLGGGYIGARNRRTALGQETELVCLPEALYKRIERAAALCARGGKD